MALPKLENQNLIQGQAEISKKIDSGVGLLHAELQTQSKSLGRIDKWLGETYELHREYYQMQNEMMREEKRALEKNKRLMSAGGAGVIGGTSVAGGNRNGNGGNGLVKMLADSVDSILLAGVSVFGISKASQVAQVALNKKNASKIAQAAASNARNASKAAQASSVKPNSSNRFVGPQRRQVVGPEKPGFLDSAEDKIRKRAQSKPSGTVVDDALRGTPKSKIFSIFRRIFPPLAMAEGLAVNIKDSVDIYKDYFDNDIATEIQKKDLGGVIGGAIGGVVGLVGGPMGAAFGLSIGNAIGEYIGGKFDDDFTDNFALSSMKLNEQSEKAKQNLKDLNEARKKGLVSDHDYIESKRKIETDMFFFNQMDEQQKLVDEMLQQRRVAADDYNELSKKLKDQQRSGKGVDEGLVLAVENAKKSFELMDARFDYHAEQFEKEFNQELALQKAQDSGLYRKKFFGKSSIDRDMLSGASLGELRAILGDKDLGIGDSRIIRELIGERTGVAVPKIGTVASNLQGAFNKAVASGSAGDMRSIINAAQGLGGEKAVLALAQGKLTDAMLKSPPKAQTQSSATTGLGGMNYRKYASEMGMLESSGRYGITGGANDAYLGKYQLGGMALEDIGLVKNGKRSLNDPNNWNNGLTKQKFLDDPKLQEEAMAAYTKKNYGYLRNYGVLSDSSTKQEIAGYLAASHLRGAKGGGLTLSKGIVTKDALGTSTASYYNSGSMSQIGASSTGSISGGSAGSYINQTGKINSAMSGGGYGSGGVTINNNTVDSSIKSSTTNNNALPAAASRSKNTGVVNDYGYGLP